MKQKIITLLNQLNHGLVEREETLKTALLTVLAGENIVLIGPPGTGKSMLARRIADGLAVDKGEYFEYLLTKFSTPEEIFGPLSITELKQDRFKRNTAGYLPTVKMAFLDEIFKASSSILNALLTILNERVYHNGAEPQRVPLRGLIAASNELPTDQEELSALYDRFLVRGFVDYVKPENLKKMFEKTGDSPDLSKLTAADLDQIQRNAQLVDIPEDVIDVILLIWEKHKETFKEDRRESLSDRRLKKVLHLLRVSAATNGRTEVDLSDVLLLKDCLWNHQDNAIKVGDLIRKLLSSLSYSVPRNDTEATATTTQNLTKYIQKMNAVVKGFRGSGTEQDPLLIENLHELMGLKRPEVGLQGYYFLQTADVDCSDLTHWTKFEFKGHYNGAGFSIKKTGSDSICSENIFENIRAGSSICSLRLINVHLAKSVQGSKISYCQSNTRLIGYQVYGCHINDCEVILNKTLCGVGGSGGLMLGEFLADNSVVEHCFVAGSLLFDKASHNARTVSGISNQCISSSICESVLGDLNLGLITGISLNGRLAAHNQNGIFENNASIDSNCGADDYNGKDGATIAAILLNKGYFEHALNWDFDTVWQWNDKENRPTLRAQRISTSNQANSAAQQVNMIDLLTQQISANIWL